MGRPTGEWSSLENVRHLLFAQQHHFAQHLPRGFRWSSAGVPPLNKTGDQLLMKLDGNLKHVELHAREIERLLRS